MKKINFTKMAGAGNGFVVVEKPGVYLKKLVINICSPKTGLGTDGLLVLDKSQKADYRMRIINADGSEAEMCGNGARCLAAYIATNKKPKKKLLKPKMRNHFKKNLPEKRKKRKEKPQKNAFPKSPPQKKLLKKNKKNRNQDEKKHLAFEK